MGHCDTLWIGVGLLILCVKRTEFEIIVFQTMDAFSIIREVEGIFTRYWGGHFEVVTVFFSRPRPREQLIAWLDLQISFPVTESRQSSTSFSPWRAKT